MRDTFAAEPFRIAVPDAILADLDDRLARTRWPIEPRTKKWLYGTDLAYMREVVAHWRTRYNWRHWEAKLNRFPQYRTDLGEIKIHFMLERGSGDNPLPLVLTHGWPGSVVEFIDIIEPLAHPERFGGDVSDAFTVVVPSLPGYGFSDPPAAPITPRDVAALWRELMVDRLGCERYVAQGGDWGACVTSWLGLDFSDHLAAIHLNMLGLIPSTRGAEELSAEEAAWRDSVRAKNARETAYQQIQGTKPQTLSYGLTDSPAGLAAWILEKFQGWTVPGSEAAPPFDLDHLLTNVMIYWVTGINASNWLYVSFVEGTAWGLAPGRRVDVPTGIILFPDDLIPPAPDKWIRRAYNLQHRGDGPSGGHFAAMENGPLLVEDMRAFFRAYR